MAAPKRTTGGGIVKQVITHVVNPENLMRAWEIANKDDRVVEFVRNVHLPRNLKPLERVRAQLDAIEKLLDESPTDLVSETSLVSWRRSLTSLRAAIPLVETAKGKSRRAKVKDLQARTDALQGKIYNALVGGDDDD